MWPWDAPGSAGLRGSAGVLQTRTKKPVGPSRVLGFALIPQAHLATSLLCPG